MLLLSTGARSIVVKALPAPGGIPFSKLNVTTKLFIMKKLCLLAIALCTVCATHAQTEFSVPDLTIEEKFDAAKAHMYRHICSAIVEAKAGGMTPEEFGKKLGRQWIPVWDNNPEFEQLVNFSIWSWAALSDEVKILEQSTEKVVVLVPSLSREMEEAPILESFSIEDLVAYFDGMMSEIATHLGFSMKMTWGDQGMKAVITR